MARSTSRKTARVALSETTAIVPANIGDNSGLTGHVLPMPEDTHREIETTLAAIATSEKALDYARQKLAHLLFDRHEQLVATKPAGSVPFAHVLAVDPILFTKYQDELATEFVLADPEAFKKLTAQEQRAHVQTIARRVGRALRLFVNLAWFKTNNPNAVCDWDYDIARWRVSPLAFVPAGYDAAGSLLKMADKTTDVLSVIMEDDDSDAYHWIMKARTPPTVINLSLDQFTHAIATQIKASRDPNLDTSTNEPTAGRATRAARQAGATATPAQTEANIATEDSDTPEATAPSVQVDRSWALGQFLRNLIAAGKFLAMDELADLSWSDFSKDAYNFAMEFRILFDRMDAKPDGKASAALAAATGVPAKPATRKRAA